MVRVSEMGFTRADRSIQTRWCLLGNMGGLGKRGDNLLLAVNKGTGAYLVLAWESTTIGGISSPGETGGWSVQRSGAEERRQESWLTGSVRGRTLGTGAGIARIGPPATMTSNKANPRLVSNATSANRKRRQAPVRSDPPGDGTLTKRSTCRPFTRPALIGQSRLIADRGRAQRYSGP